MHKVGNRYYSCGITRLRTFNNSYLKTNESFAHTEYFYPKVHDSFAQRKYIYMSYMSFTIVYFLFNFFCFFFCTYTRF